MSDDGAQDGRGTGRRRAEGDDLSARLERLETRLDRKRPAAPPPGAASSEPSAMGRAFRMSAEFVAGVLAGGGLGYLLDRVAGTSPWGLDRAPAARLRRRRLERDARVGISRGAWGGPEAAAFGGSLRDA